MRLSFLDYEGELGSLEREREIRMHERLYSTLIMPRSDDWERNGSNIQSSFNTFQSFFEHL